MPVWLFAETLVLHAQRDYQFDYQHRARKKVAATILKFSEADLLNNNREKYTPRVEPNQRALTTISTYFFELFNPAIAVSILGENQFAKLQWNRNSIC